MLHELGLDIAVGPTLNEVYDKAIESGLAQKMGWELEPPSREQIEARKAWICRSAGAAIQIVAYWDADDKLYHVCLYDHDRRGPKEHIRQLFHRVTGVLMAHGARWDA